MKKNNDTRGYTALTPQSFTMKTLKHRDRESTDAKNLFKDSQ